MRPRIDHLGVHLDAARPRAEVEISRNSESGSINRFADVMRLPWFPILPLGIQMYAPDGLKSGPASNCGSGFVEDRKHRLTPDHRRLPTPPPSCGLAQDRAAAP